MKRILILSIYSLLSLFSMSLNAQEKDSSAWGKIVKLPDGQAIQGHKYFVTLRKDGVDLAYPLLYKGKESELEKLVDKTARITGEAVPESFDAGEIKQNLVVFHVKKVELLNLSDLAPIVDPTMEKNAPMAQQAKNQGGLRINDKVTNTVIIGAGAILAIEVLRGLLRSN